MSGYCNHCMAQLEVVGGKCPVCGKENTDSVPAHHLLPGTILNGKFYVGVALGEGGFGITYIGRDLKLDMKVAIKEFYPNGYVNRSNTISPRVNDSVTGGRRDFFEKGRERFLKEAQILAKFSGEPGVVDVRDFFEENNTAYIIMEYLDGVDLKTYLRKNGRLTPEHTIQLLMPVMNSLKKIHAQGLIHRDISPDNIMIVGDKVKLLDFGAARTVSAEANKSLSVMLKPGYAPEEQYRSKGNQGPWTDVYALCATMYKCITGITPDDATQRVFSDEVKPPSALNIVIKPEIERAIMKGMSIHQKDRYQCIEDLIRGLQGIEVSVSVTDQTVTAGKNIPEEDVETVYVPYNTDYRMDMNAPVRTSVSAKDNSKNFETAGSASLGTHHNNGGNEPPQKRKSKTGLIVIASVVAAAVIALIIFLIAFRGSSDVPENGGNSGISTQIPDSNETVDTDTIVDTDASVATDTTVDTGSTVDTDTAVDTDASVDTSDGSVAVTLSDDLYDFTFQLEGVVYKLPCQYEDFTSNGWTISSRGYNSDTKISGNSYATFSMSKDGRQIMVYSYNMSGNTKPIKECKIGGIECEEYNDVDFVIAKGITVLSSAEEVENAFGIPGDSYSGDGYESLTYYAENDSYNNSIEFYCYSGGEYSSITMRNFVETEDDATTTSTEKPEYLSTYKAPDSMGADLKSAVFKIEEDLYQLPAPVSEFIDNGWEITRQSGYVVAGGMDSISLEKDGKQLDAYIVNYAEYQTTAENCAVYEIYVYDNDNVNIFVGPESKPVTIGTTKADVDAILPEDFEVEEYTNEYTYSYAEYEERDFTLYVNIDKETGTVSYISISCETWGY